MSENSTFAFQLALLLCKLYILHCASFINLQSHLSESETFNSKISDKNGTLKKYCLLLIYHFARIEGISQ
jgi:hypothetical protein